MRNRWFAGFDHEIISKEFVPVAFDCYFIGDQFDKQFVQKVKRGTNNSNSIVISTPSGLLIDADTTALAGSTQKHQWLRRALHVYNSIPKQERVADPVFSSSNIAVRNTKKRPTLPKGSFVIRGFSTLPQVNDVKGRGVGSTQTDTAWIHAHEVNEILDDATEVGATVHVPLSVQHRLLESIAIPYLEGTNRALRTRDSRMWLEVVAYRPRDAIAMELRGWAQLGAPYDPQSVADQERGCQLWLNGRVEVSALSELDRFDLVGIGQCWGARHGGNLPSNVLGQRIWDYGVIWVLADRNKPINRVPPYNSVHYPAPQKR